jgi:hypothetical protein
MLASAKTATAAISMTTNTQKPKFQLPRSNIDFLRGEPNFLLEKQRLIGRKVQTRQAGNMPDWACFSPQTGVF